MKEQYNESTSTSVLNRQLNTWRDTEVKGPKSLVKDTFVKFDFELYFEQIKALRDTGRSLLYIFDTLERENSIESSLSALKKQVVV